MTYPLLALHNRHGPARSATNIVAWLDRVRARPAWQRAVEKGGAPIPE